MTSTSVHLHVNQTVRLDHFGSGRSPNTPPFTAVELAQPYGRDLDKGLLSGANITFMVGEDSAPVALELAERLREAALRFLPEPAPVAEGETVVS